MGDRLTIGGPRGSLVVRRITHGSCMCAMSPGCRRCVAADIASLPKRPEIHAVVRRDGSYKSYPSLGAFSITGDHF